MSEHTCRICGRSDYILPMEFAPEETDINEKWTTWVCVLCWEIIATIAYRRVRIEMQKAQDAMNHNKRIYISGLNSLKSNSEYDFAHNIEEGTHKQIQFTIYEDDNDTSKGWTSYNVIISDEELFNLLKDRAMIEVQKASK